MEKHHSRCFLFFLFFFFFLISATVPVGYGYQYKVGDLNAWGIPPSSNPRIYSLWSEYNQPLVGDSLLFLYPPSQDSVIQVTAAAFAGCNTSDPILNMNNGNSLFNVTSNGTFYFISGTSGHCQKNQKLQVSIGSGSAVGGPGVGPADNVSPSSYPTVFGSIPVANSTASSSEPSLFPGLVAFAAIVGSVAGALAVI
ncbi:hypothetical protein MLD38_031852 [Melastoma candidum]|uniref:Uncharacterized protein n=1 Tax=Melastoma candidum TaxID=119954 RepID=A0ACB9MQF5_9MYRT|nr:hypothetical protein MLD38_031852 [Melastoma candidum]